MIRDNGCFAEGVAEDGLLPNSDCSHCSKHSMKG
jgi:hypothetical protein